MALYKTQDKHKNEKDMFINKYLYFNSHAEYRKTMIQLIDEYLLHHRLLISPNPLQCKKVKKLLQLFCCSFWYSKISNKICTKEPKATLHVTQMTVILYFITSKRLQEIEY